MRLLGKHNGEHKGKESDKPQGERDVTSGMSQKGHTSPPKPIVMRLLTLNQKQASAKDMCGGISPIKWLRSSQIT